TGSGRRPKTKQAGKRLRPREIRLRRTGSPTRRRIYTTFRTWPGVTEVELGVYLDSKGLPVSCHPMVSTGEKARWALTSPSSRAVARGDQFTTAFGVRGGLTCRAGYVAESIDDLKTSVRDWIDQIVKPYFAAVATWYETIGIGVTGGEVYEAVQNVFPRERYGW